MHQNSLSPTDVKLATGSDDGTIRTFDFIRCSEEFILRGISTLTRWNGVWHQPNPPCLLPRTVLRSWCRRQVRRLAPQEEPDRVRKQGLPATGQTVGRKERTRDFNPVRILCVTWSQSWYICAAQNEMELHVRRFQASKQQMLLGRYTVLKMSELSSNKCFFLAWKICSALNNVRAFKQLMLLGIYAVLNELSECFQAFSVKILLDKGRTWLHKLGGNGWEKSCILSTDNVHPFSCSHIHKAAVHCVKWNKNGNWLLTASKDSLIKVFDIRMMKEMFTLKGHKKEVTSKHSMWWRA